MVLYCTVVDDGCCVSNSLMLLLISHDYGQHEDIVETLSHWPTYFSKFLTKAWSTGRRFKSQRQEVQSVRRPVIAVAVIRVEVHHWIKTTIWLLNKQFHRLLVKLKVKLNTIEVLMILIGFYNIWMFTYDIDTVLFYDKKQRRNILTMRRK